MSSLDLDTVLASARTIAVVGCSPRGFQTSHRIARYIQNVGMRMIPVNPHQEEILGETCYPNVQSIPDDIDVDIVDVFRRPQFTEGVVDDVAERAEATGQRPVVWTQIGVHSEAAEQAADAAGLPYVADRCLMVDHAALARAPNPGSGG